MESLFVSLEKEVFRGNVLDITYENEGIIYNTNKYYDNFIDVDYLESALAKEGQLEEHYDSCILFFSLNKVKSNKEREHLFNKIYKSMRKNGYIYIWDIEKRPLQVSNINIRVSLPDKTLRNLKVNLYNVLSDNTPEKIINNLKDDFDIVEIITSNGIFKIVGRKKGC
ncbi:hypothetical protein [Clostridium sp.]|uniref:hypothetical protein n=1 Tax=Clostridium sp. TaxID=1506 RepID=UPI003217774A